MRAPKFIWRAAAAALAAAGIAALARMAFRDRDAGAAPAEEIDLIEQAGLESFPASDPPGWTLGEE